MAARAGLSVRRRLAADTRAVRRVARAAWRATYARLTPPGFIRAVLREGYARDALVLGLVDRFRDAFVVERGRWVVGYADVVVQPDGTAELVRIYVAPDEQGRGAGAALLEACADAARRRGVAFLFVAVHDRNRRALRWYRRQGFEPAGRDEYRLRTWTHPLVRLALPLVRVSGGPPRP